MLFNISSSSNQPPDRKKGVWWWQAPKKVVKRMKAFCQTHSKNTVWSAPAKHAKLQHSPWGTRPLRIDCPLVSRKNRKTSCRKRKKGGKWKSVSRDHLLDIRALWRDEFEFPPPISNRRKPSARISTFSYLSMMMMILLCGGTSEKIIIHIDSSRKKNNSS